MTQTPETASPDGRSHRLWTETLFVVGAAISILAIAVYQVSTGFAGVGIGVRIAGILLSFLGGIVLAVWAARRPELSGKRRGAFTLTWAIISLLAGGVVYLIGLGLAFVMKVPVFGPAASLTTTLVAFGAIALVAGVIKRINA